MLIDLNQFSWADHYNQYLNLQERGLRKLAFIELDAFILEFQKQDKIARWRFIDYVNKVARKTEEYNLYIPYSLFKNIFEPEINDWMSTDPKNPIPYKWSSDFNLLRRSVELNPHDQDTLEIYYARLINTVCMNQHEIEPGFGYNGNPERDLLLIKDGEQYIIHIEEYEKRSRVTERLDELKKVTLSFIKR